MSSIMGPNIVPVNFADPNWLNVLLEDYEEEVRQENRWPILLLQPVSRQLIWRLCGRLRVNKKGIPASACRLMERYLCSHIRCYLRINEEWEQFKISLASRYHLVAASCIQLAAKMADLSSPLTATMVQIALIKEGIDHTKAEIVENELDVYRTLDFRIPLWTTLETAEYLAYKVNIRSPIILTALSLIIDLSEFNKNWVQHRMRNRNELCNTPGSSSSSTGPYVLRSLHLCAGCVCAAARFLRVCDPTEGLASLTRTTPAHIKAIADIIISDIIKHQ